MLVWMPEDSEGKVTALISDYSILFGACVLDLS